MPHASHTSPAFARCKLGLGSMQPRLACSVHTSRGVPVGRCVSAQGGATQCSRSDRFRCRDGRERHSRVDRRIQGEAAEGESGPKERRQRV